MAFPRISDLRLFLRHFIEVSGRLLMICLSSLIGTSSVAQTELFDQLKLHRNSEEYLPLDLYVQLQEVPSAQLDIGLHYPDCGVKLQVAWEKTRRTLQDDNLGEIEKQSLRYWFLGYTEGLLGVQAPQAWRDGFLHGTVVEERFSPAFDEVWLRDDNVHWDNETKTLISTNLQIEAAKAFRSKWGKNQSGNSMAIYSDGGDWFTVFYDCQVSMRAELEMRHEDAMGTKLKWQSEILNSGDRTVIDKGSASEFDKSAVEGLQIIKGNQEIIVVYGLSGNECWIEFFSRKLGERLGYFSSTKWKLHPSGIYSNY